MARASPLTRGLPNAAACQDRSARSMAGAIHETNVPEPGLVSTIPSLIKRRRADWTVTGPTPWRSAKNRVEGSRAPGAAAVANWRRSSITTSILLLCFMSIDNSAIQIESVALLEPGQNDSKVLYTAVAWGLVGVLAFSLTFPMTRLALRSLDPQVIGFGRGVWAGLLAGIALISMRAPRPRGRQWVELGLIGAGVVTGFPVLASMALQHVDASHGAVINGILPLLTAVAAVLLAREHMPKAFWLAGLIGTAGIVAFALRHGVGHLQPADGLLVAAVVLGAMGYAIGGRLAREWPPWQVISWALVIYLPVSATGFGLSVGRHGFSAPIIPLIGFVYVCAISQFLGFVAWYRGLAVGGIAKVSQVQLLQTPFSLFWAALLLGEALGPAILVTTAVVLVSVVVGQRSGTIARRRYDSRPSP